MEPSILDSMAHVKSIVEARRLALDARGSVCILIHLLDYH